MAIGTPIGGIRVDLTLNSAAFIRDIAKTNAAIAGNTRQMTTQLNRLQRASEAVGATFGAWITVRTVKKVISFLDQSIDLAAKLHNNLGKAAKEFNNQAEAMSNAFKLGVAQGFMDSLQEGLSASGISLEKLASAGIIMGNVLGKILADIVNFFTHDIPEGVKTSINSINSVIQAYNDARRARDLAAQQGSALAGGAAGSGLLGPGDVSAGIPLIDTSGIESSTKAWLDYAGAAGIAKDALALATEAQRMATRSGEEFSRIADLNRQLYDQIRTPMEAYEAQLSRISAAQLDAASTAKLQSMAQAELANTWLSAASAVSGALTSMFKENKAIAIANAVINTAEAISAALKNPPGPPFSFVYATAAAIAGAAQIAAIASASPGNAKTPKVKGGGGGGSKVQKAVSETSTSSGSTPGQAVNITLVGQGGFDREQVRALIGQINQAVGDGATLRVSG